jgi:sister chromatid cohesion protein DCC1
VTLSNSVFVVCPSPDVGASDKQVVIQDSLNELLELVPAVPKLHRMNVLLKEHEWEEGHEEDDESFSKVGPLDVSRWPHWPGLENIL